MIAIDREFEERMGPERVQFIQDFLPDVVLSWLDLPGDSDALRSLNANFSL